jgi:hypothetical protein
MEPLRHDWKLIREDSNGAVYDCLRCGVSQVVWYFGVNIETITPPPPEFCEPRKVETKSDGKESHVR